MSDGDVPAVSRLGRIESLTDGASSRRNQVLMDLGKEFGVPAIDGAHEVPLGEEESGACAG